MTRLSFTPKSAKQHSRFHKLWNRAAKLRRENERFRERLDQLVQRMHREILPEERRAAVEQIPLLKRLLVLGQRKTLSRWHRIELSDWIMELVEPLAASGQLDKQLEDDISRYHAFNLGIDLDEGSEQSLAQQLEEFHDQQQDELTDVFGAESADEARARVEREVEQELDKALGPAPDVPEGADDTDLFADELHAARQQAFNAYQQRRSEMREHLIQDRMAEMDFEDDEYDVFDDFDPFVGDDDFDDPFSGAKDSASVISNEVFTRLFRATVAVLHPDRAPDEARQKHNHQLMAQLLKARKQGDVMTIIDLYQQHVGDEAGLTNKDEKQLVEALERQIDELKDEKDEYSYSSPLHRAAFEQFYRASAKKTDKAFREHIAYIRESASHMRELADQIRSLKTLKPYLEMRYQEQRLDITFDELIEDLIRSGPFR